MGDDYADADAELPTGYADAGLPVSAVAGRQVHLASVTLIDFDAGTATPFVRSGACKQCGACCSAAVAYELSEATPEHGVWRCLAAGLWYRHTRLIAASGRCQYLTDGNACMIHATKPELCREFPLLPAEIMPGCGYVFEIAQG